MQGMNTNLEKQVVQHPHYLKVLELLQELRERKLKELASAEDMDTVRRAQGYLSLIMYLESARTNYANE